MQTSAYCPFSLECADLHLHYKGTNCKGLQSEIRAATHPDFQCAQRSVISALGNQDHSHVSPSLSLSPGLPCTLTHTCLYSRPLGVTTHQFWFKAANGSSLNNSK